MCGIAAVLGNAKPKKAVRAMLARLRHRGDCSDPCWSPGPGAALGAERLRIVDTAGGTQPVWSADGEWLIAFNGEIYNHAELRGAMEKAGVKFKSTCDTEVLANLVAREGVAGLEQLDGMFAFVAINRDGKRFLAARDPMGVKPLYHVCSGDQHWFASEILPLTEAVACLPVDVVAPGAWLTESGHGLYFRRTPRPVSTGSLAEHAATLAGLLEEAVKKRMPPSLPCAVLFSGGIDSTLVFHMARKLNSETKGFYIGNPHGEDWDAAHLYTRALGADVEFIPIVEDDVLAIIPEVVRTCETFEPNQIRGGCLSYLLARHVHDRGYRVALCGEGADELFCGYPELQFTDKVEADCETELRHARSHFLDELHRTQLQRVDRCSMRHQLEVRVPFLDRQIVRFADTLPLEHLVVPNAIRLDANKIVLRAVYDCYPDIPRVLGERKKVVFTAGSGMGDNSPRGPFYDFACSRAMTLPGRDTLPPFRNGEEHYYIDLLNQVFDPSRVPTLSNRPRLNSR